MGKKLDIVTPLHQSTKRDYLARMIDNKVEAMLVVPISAHALFAKPLVVSPKSVVELVVTTGPVEVSCDRRRKTELATGATIRVVRNTQSVKLARIHLTPFTERLVAKFELPVHGWRAQ